MRDPAQASPGWGDKTRAGGAAARNQQRADSGLWIARQPKKKVDCHKGQGRLLGKEQGSTSHHPLFFFLPLAWTLRLPPPPGRRQYREPTLLSPLVQGMQTPTIPFGGQRRRPFGAFTNGFLEKCGSSPVRQPVPAQDVFGRFSRKSDGSVFLGQAWKYGGHPMSIPMMPACDTGMDGRGAEESRGRGSSMAALLPFSPPPVKRWLGLARWLPPPSTCLLLRCPFTSLTFPSIPYPHNFFFFPHFSRLA